MRMLNALILAVLLAGCVDGPQTGPDAGQERTCPTCSESFDSPIGASCEAAESLLCGGGFGLCYSGACRAQCRESIPRCAPAEIQTDGELYGRRVCVCVPH